MTVQDNATRGTRAMVQWVGLFAALVGVTLVAYRSALGFGFNSDAFVLLGNARQSLLHAVTWDGSYHYMPLTAAWLWLQHVVFGLDQQAYQIVNIIQHGLMAGLVAVLGTRLGIGKAAAALAGLLYAVSGNSYQVVLWSVVGSNYFVSGIWYLASVALFVTALERSDSRLKWISAGCFLLALFSHEQSLSVLPVCGAYSLFVHRACGRLGLEQLGRLRIWLSALADLRLHLGPLAVFLGTKLAMSFHTAVTGGAGFTPTQALGFFAKGLIGCVSLRGDYRFIDPLLRPLGSPATAWIVITIGFVAVTLVMWKGRPVDRFLLVWAIGHLVMMQLAIGIAIRHQYLPTVATTILLGRWIVGLACNVGASVGHRRPDMRTATAVATGVALTSVLVVPALSDLATAQAHWSRADAVTRSFLQALDDAATSSTAERIVVVDATKEISSPGFEIYTFQNGLEHAIDMIQPGAFPRLTLWHITPGPNVAHGSQLVRASEVAAAISARHTAVLWHNRRNGTFDAPDAGGDHALERAGTAPSLHLPTNRPELPWNDHGALVIPPPPTPPLLLETASPRLHPVFLAVTRFTGQGRPLSVVVGEHGLPVLTETAGSNPHWKTHLIPVPAGRDPVTPILLASPGPLPALVRAVGLVHPGGVYDPVSAPYLPWTSNGTMRLHPGAALELPFPACESDGCSLRIAYRSLPNRAIRMDTGEGRGLRLPVVPDDGDWTLHRETFSLPAGQTDAITLTCEGPAVCIVGRVALARDQSTS